LDVGVAFDVRRLPAAYGTKTTEMLIDSLFNPVRVSDRADESPFTIYDPPSSPDRSPLPLSNANATPKEDTTYRRLGLGLVGMSDTDEMVILHHTGEAGESSSIHTTTTTTTTTTSDSASEQFHTATGSLYSGLVMPQNARSTPEGRVLAGGGHGSVSGGGKGPGPGHMKVASEDSTASSVGAVRSWWRRNLSKHNLTMTKTPS
jgi:hypothetical protein